MAIEEEFKTFQGTQEALADRLDKGLTKVKMALRITKALNPAARDMVDENLQKTLKNEGRTATSKNKGFLISENTLLVLADLEDLGQVQPALQVVMDDYLTTGQAQKLVEHIQSGNPADTFMVSAQLKRAPRLDTSAQVPETFSLTTKPSSRSTSPKPSEPATHSAHHLGEGQPANAESHPPATHPHPTHLSPSGDNASAVPGTPAEPDKADSTLEFPNGDKTASSKTGTSPNDNAVGDPISQKLHGAGNPNTELQPTQTSNWFWKLVLGIPFIKRLKKKVEKNEPLTGPEKAFLLFYRFYESLLKPAGKLFKKGLLFLWDKWRNLGGKKNRWFFDIVGFLLISWFLTWAVMKVVHTILIPVRWIENKVEGVFHADSHNESAQSSPVSQPVAETQMSLAILPKVEVAVNHLIPKKKAEAPAPVPTSASVYQPSIAFNTSASPTDSSSPININNGDKPVMTLYDPKLLEQEIAALPKNCIVKAYPLSPDESMPWDMAVSRLQDLIDPDKYTMFIGSSKEKITFITPNNTNLIINYKSTDPFDIWGSSGPINIFWEDVLYIHTDKIDVEDKTSINKIFQISLVSSSSKYALTIQCATAPDMSHLVSTFEYFIRHSRLGHDTVLAGLPYPTQGVRFNNDCVVEKLWADSPMDKSGVALGEMIWSLEKNAADQPDHKKLLAGLAALAPGSHAIFVVSPADRDKAQSDVSFGRARDFNPRRRKVIFSVP